MPSRLRVPVEGLDPGVVQLPGDMARYVTRVHRSKPGDEVELFDPAQALRARGIIETVEPNRVLVRVHGELEAAPTFNMPVVLMQAVGKGDKPEQAVRDATALGAAEVHFVHTERGVARSSSEHKLQRLNRVAGQVARQCGRGDLPRITAPQQLPQAIESLPPGGRRLLCGWGAASAPLLDVAEELEWKSQVAMLIGPEGGFCAAEIELATSRGFRVVGLGPYVLRTEVACSVALGTLRAAHVRSSARQEPPGSRDSD